MKVGVVGAGVMGAGVTQALLEAGHVVVLVDVDEAALRRARRDVHRGIASRALFTPAAERTDVDAALRRVIDTTDYAMLGDVEFVIENTTEKVAVKEAVYAHLDEVCPPPAVLAANTSAILIEQLAACTGRPTQVLGMHFMNPAPMKPAVEVIRARETSDATLATALDLLASMGKEGIVVGDRPGFVSNRVLMLTVNEAVGVLADGVAPAEDVDRVFTACFGHKMGPLETADLIGLDTILLSLEVLRDAYASDRFEPAPLLRELVGRGDLGRKTGRGFFSYGTGGS